MVMWANLSNEIKAFVVTDNLLEQKNKEWFRKHWNKIFYDAEHYWNWRIGWKDNMVDEYNQLILALPNSDPSIHGPNYETVLEMIKRRKKLNFVNPSIQNPYLVFIDQ